MSFLTLLLSVKYYIEATKLFLVNFCYGGLKASKSVFLQMTLPVLSRQDN